MRPILVQSMQFRCFQALSRRMQGPGWYYNLGNAFGLLTGISLHLAGTAATGNDVTTISGTIDYLAGGPSAVLLSIAMLIFFWSGECYHRAWSEPNPPVYRFNKLGDILSGWGALALGLGLLILDQPILALTAGLLHAAGKFGSAYATQSPDFWPSHWPDFWRFIVLLSRIPALLAVLIELAGQTIAPTEVVDILSSISILLCYLLWIRADLLLFDSK